MRLKHALLLSGSLFLASCGMQATPAPTAAQTAPQVSTAKTTISSTNSLQTLSVKPDALTVGVPEDATYVTFTLQGTKLPDGKVFPGVIQNGQASIDLSGLPEGDP